MTSPTRLPACPSTCCPWSTPCCLSINLLHAHGAALIRRQRWRAGLGCGPLMSSRYRVFQANCLCVHACACVNWTLLCQQLLRAQPAAITAPCNLPACPFPTPAFGPLQCTASTAPVLPPRPPRPAPPHLSFLSLAPTSPPHLPAQLAPCPALPPPAPRTLPTCPTAPPLRHPHRSASSSLLPTWPVISPRAASMRPSSTRPRPPTTESSR